MKTSFHQGPFSRLLFALLLVFGLGTQISACTIMATRPVQSMADASAAIRAAREVKADQKEGSAIELFRKALDWFERAKVEFRMHNFSQAELYANRARIYAEASEFEVCRGGCNREEAGLISKEVEAVSDPMANPNFSNLPTPQDPGTGDQPTQIKPESDPTLDKLDPDKL
jgi:hypothetical protein